MCTPPATEGALEGITLDIVEALAHSMNIEFIRRPIDRTELLVADEIALCGSLAVLIPAKSIDGLPLPEASPVLTALQTRYLEGGTGRPASFRRLGDASVMRCLQVRRSSECGSVALKRPVQRATPWGSARERRDDREDDRKHCQSDEIRVQIYQVGVRSEAFYG